MFACLSKMLAGVSKIHFLVALAVAFLGLGLFSSGLYIHAKALVAQHLLERSWQRVVDGQHAATEIRPWPWADTYPVARINFSSKQHSAIVLHGASGEALAFGPAHLSRTALPGENGNSVIAGHRDTHFQVLQSLRIGDRIEIERAAKGTTYYQVTATWIVNENDITVLEDLDAPALTLITCYPFDAKVPGGPLRFIVRARAIDMKSA